MHYFPVTSLDPSTPLRSAHGESFGPESNFRFSPGNHQLHGRAADVDDQDLFFMKLSFRATVMGESLISGFVWDSASLRACLRERSRKCSCACERGSPSLRFESDIGAVGLKFAGFHVIVQKTGKHFVDNLVSERRSSIGNAISTRRKKFRGIQSALARYTSGFPALSK